MKTVCAFDNVACIADQFSAEPGSWSLLVAVITAAMFCCYLADRF